MPPRPTDLLGPGDVLNITVYEAGVSLFGTALRTAAAGGKHGDRYQLDGGAPADDAG